MQELSNKAHKLIQKKDLESSFYAHNEYDAEDVIESNNTEIIHLQYLGISEIMNKKQKT